DLGIHTVGTSSDAHWPALAAGLAGVEAADPDLAVEPAALLMIVFTSGTTRAPKGVLNSQGRLMMLGWGASLHMCHFTPDDVVYCAMSLYPANRKRILHADPSF